MSKQYTGNIIDKKRYTKEQVRVYIFAVAIFILLITIAVLYCFLSDREKFSPLNPQKHDSLMKNDLAKLSEEAYESVFLSMHSSEGFRQEDFASFRGLETVVASHVILNTKELSQYMDCLLCSDNQVTNIYLCLDPELLWTNARQKEDKWNTNLETGLYSYVRDNPDTVFEIMLPYPYIEYWLQLSDDKLDILLNVYRTLVEQLLVYPNTRIYFPGFEYWLMVNPDNYTNSLFTANEIVTQKLLLYTFCDGNYRITLENEDSCWNSLRETITREKNTPADYPDLSQWHLVFFGDSVLAHNPGSYSIPGYIAGLSNITYDNCAVGGTCATFAFPMAVNTFLESQTTEEPLQPVNKKLCFVINYGLNDYFTGKSIDNSSDPFGEGTYKGSLRSGISRLQQAFPDASYIIMTPTHVSLFENGTTIMSEEGDVLTAYIEAAREISEEMGLYLIDNYEDFIVTAENLTEYTADGVHPNEKGRLAIAVRIMDFLGQ